MLGLKVVSLCGNARVIYPRVERLSAGGLLVEEHQLTRPVLGKELLYHVKLGRGRRGVLKVMSHVRVRGSESVWQCQSYLS